jgi:hypothetical protein
MDDSLRLSLPVPCHHGVVQPEVVSMSKGSTASVFWAPSGWTSGLVVQGILGIETKISQENLRTW